MQSFMHFMQTQKLKKETPTLIWEILLISISYTNITKPDCLCLYEQLAILLYPNQKEIFLKKDQGYFQKCQHKYKSLLTFNSND